MSETFKDEHGVMPRSRWIVESTLTLSEELDTLASEHRKSINATYRRLVDEGAVSAHDKTLIDQTEMSFEEKRAKLRRLSKIAGFFSLKGLEEVEYDLGDGLDDYHRGHQGEIIGRLVRSEKERDENGDDIDPLTITEAIECLLDDHESLLDFVKDNMEEVDRAYAAMRRAKDPDWKPGQDEDDE